MAKVFVSEYDTMPILSGQAVVTGMEPAIAEQVVAIAAGNTQSAAFNARTKFVRLHTDAICSFKFGTAALAVATANTPRLAANSTEFFGVVPGQVVGIITNT